MAIHHFRLLEFILPYIESGEKDLEVRVWDSKRKHINIGDTIVFDRRLHRRVKAIYRYDSFDEMLKVQRAERIMPGWNANRIRSGLSAIYPPEREALGVVVFELEVIH